MLSLFVLFRSEKERLLLRSSLLQKYVHSGGFKLPSLSKGTSDSHQKEVFKWVISSKLFLSITVAPPPSSITFLTVAPLLTSRLLSFIWPFCIWEVLLDFGTDHPPILLRVLLTLLFHPNGRLPSHNFHKARCSDFGFYLGTYYPTKEYSSVSLSYVATLFILWH